MHAWIDPSDPNRLPPEPDTPEDPEAPDRRPPVEDDPEAQRAPGAEEGSLEQPPPMQA